MITVVEGVIIWGPKYDPVILQWHLKWKLVKSKIIMTSQKRGLHFKPKTYLLRGGMGKLSLPYFLQQFIDQKVMAYSIEYFRQLLPDPSSALGGENWPMLAQYCRIN